MTCAKLHDATHATGGKKTKPTILVFSRYYLPGYKAGGPIQSIANTLLKPSVTSLTSVS